MYFNRQKLTGVLLLALLTMACGQQKSKPTITNTSQDQIPDNLISTDSLKPIDTNMFPAAKNGYKKIVIQVPENKNEKDLKVEIICGRILDVDLCNYHYLVGKSTEKNLKGWGYTYFEVESDGGYISTKMACPDLKTKKEFVCIEPILTRYNSKLPIVMYVPEILTVKFRIWKAGEEFENAESK